MSWKVEVVADDTGKWYSNAKRFATKERAEFAAQDIRTSWLAVRDARVVWDDKEENDSDRSESAS